MSRKRGIPLACALAMLVVFGLAGPASATSPTAVAGTWDWDNLSWVTQKVVGGNEFFSGTEQTARTGWSGDLAGTSFDTFTGVIHQNGAVVAQLTVYFDGSVLGRSGTMVMDVSCLANNGHGFAGKWFIRSGTGGLAGLHGNGSWGAWGGDLVEYSGSAHWR